MKRKRDTEQQDETDTSQTQILVGERWVVPNMTSSRARLATIINQPPLTESCNDLQQQNLTSEITAKSCRVCPTKCNWETVIS